MTRLRLISLSILLGLVLPVTTGLTPAGAQTTPRASSGPLTFEESPTDWYIHRTRNEVPYPGGWPTCSGQVHFNPSPYKSLGTNFGNDLDPDDGFGIKTDALSRGCALFEFWPAHGGGQLHFDFAAATTDTGVLCEFYVERLDEDGTVLSSEFLLKIEQYETNDAWAVREAGTANSFADGERARIVVLEFTKDGVDTCGVDKLEFATYHPDDMLGPPPDPTAFAPQLSCGRTMRDMGNDQWFADVEAIVRNPDPQAEDTGHWKVSWSDDTYAGANATIPLPAGATTNDNLWVSYWNTRTTDEFIGWSQQQETGMEWLEGPELHDGTPFLHTLPGAWLIADLIGADGEVTNVGSGYVGFDVNGDGVVGDIVPAQPQTTVKAATAICTVRVSPVTMHTDPDVVIINMPAHPDDTEPGSTDTPPPPGSEDPGTTCGGGTWWNPINWAKSIFCKLGDVVGAIADLLLGLLDGLADLFIPDDFSFVDGLRVEWESKFPLSVITDATSLGDGLHDRIDGGINGSPCSSIDPNMDGAVTHESGAALDAFKFTLPSPTGACGEDASTIKAANLVGWRPPLRAFLGIFVWLAFFVRVVTSFGPQRTGLEPDPEEALR